jgi:DNA polymerase I-like protein with 3'-5' exonuclease and polymerase domains
MSIIAADFETSLISLKEPIPRPIALCWYNGDEVTIRTSSSGKMIDHIRELFMQAMREDKKIVWHNSGFDMSVIWKEAQQYNDVKKLVIDLVEADRISDTMIREILYDISTEGVVRKGRYSLAAVGKNRLGRERNDKEDGWRLRYAELEHIPLAAWPIEAIDYMVADVQDTYDIWMSQENERTDFGPRSMNTEKLQIGAALALNWMSARGIQTNQRKIQEKEGQLRQELEDIKAFLAEEGFMRYNKRSGYTRNRKALQEYVTDNFPVRRTAPTEMYPEGQVKLSQNALVKFKDDPIVGAWLRYSTVEKQVSAYLQNLISETSLIYPQYDILKVTGRTSSFGSKNLPGTNIQNVPSNLNIRDCIVPRDGHVLVSIDYSNLELCTAAQTFYEIFKESKLLEAVNEGEEPTDLHNRLGQRIKEVDGNRLSDKEYRTMAKPIGLGYPGGLGARTMLTFAKDTYGVTFTEDQARQFKKVLVQTYPELGVYLQTYPYSNTLGGEVFFYSCNGRYRSNCRYSEFCNGKALQSPAADGAKVALWECFKAELPMLMFIHDEIIFEFPKDNFEQLIDLAQNIMIDAMQVVTPHTRITTEASVMDECWTKSGPFIYEKRMWKEPKPVKEVT